MPPFSAVLFDLDGTLTDSFEGITNCLRNALTQMGHEAPCADDLKWCVGPPIHQSFAKLVGPIRAEEGVRLYRERFSDVGWTENRVYEGVPEMLTMLNMEGIPLFVATSKAQLYVPRILQHFGLDGFFTAAYGSELNGTRDDKGELIAHVLEQERLNPEEVLMVGDRKFDVLGAAKNGVACAGVLWGYGSSEELELAGAKWVVKTPMDLANAIVHGIEPVAA